MFNNKEKISASEINRYCYCQYSWYYERLYGKKYIREKYIERNDKLGLENTTISNFNKGNKFHNTFLLKRKIILILKTIILLLIVSLLLWGAKLCGYI